VFIIIIAIAIVVYQTFGLIRRNLLQVQAYCLKTILVKSIFFRFYHHH